VQNRAKLVDVFTNIDDTLTTAGAMTGGGGRLSLAASVLSLSQKISKLVLSRVISSS
jgi:hypothetical protein